MSFANASIEPRVRRLVADRLGVSAEDLIPEASLADELAVDSLDLLEIAIAVEADLGITVAEHALADVHSYADLVNLVASLVEETRRPDAVLAPAVLATVVPGEGDPRRGGIQRALLLTPYAAETVAEDAVRAGPGARLEITLRGRVVGGTVAHVRALFARLVERGVPVRVEPEPLAHLAGSRPAA
jgi:acyl carrier protein